MSPHRNSVTMSRMAPSDRGCRPSTASAVGGSVVAMATTAEWRRHAVADRPKASGAGLLASGFAAAFVLVFLVPPFTPFAFSPDPDLRWGDVLDFATPVVMLPAYWLLLRHGRPALPRWESIVFLALAAVWVEGQGVHLAANAIGHHVSSGPGAGLTSLFDEKVGHLLWHSAALAIPLLVVLRSIPGAEPVAAASDKVSGVVAGIVYGFGFFLIAVEGTTAILAAAGGLVIAAVAWRRGAAALLARPTAAVFGVGYPVMLILLGVWFAYWGGRLPEFSSLGLIK